MFKPKNSILNYGLMGRAAKTIVVVIYGVMYTELANILRELKLSNLSTVNHMIGCAVCAPACCVNFIIL